MRRPIRRIVMSFGLCFLASLSLLAAGCQWKKPARPSILVVAIDRLGVNRGSCGPEKDDATRSGLADFCEESVRFTHAFTTSTLSAPAMGSILTGRYPYRAGLRHNGGGELGTLSAAVDTVAERALRQNYRTLFVAGAPPLLRRTGLHQGFEIFDDALQPDSRRLHRPAREVVDIFTRWLDSQDRHDSFFSVLHMGDMLVPWQPMPDDSGRMRESSVRGQFAEVDENLARLWTHLKEKNRWNNTIVVVVGLQGDSTDIRNEEVPALDLHSDTTHVTLMIKDGSRAGERPAGGEPSAGQPAYNWVPKSWSFDVNVSLADLGVTLIDWIEGGNTEDLVLDDARSLRSALRGSGTDIEEWRKHDRLIITESAWARWQVDPKLPIRAAFRKGPYLYVHDEDPTVYNTLTDAFEVAPLPRRNQKTIELREEFGVIAGSHGFQAFPGVSPGRQLEERWARTYFAQRLGARIPPNTKVDDQRIEIQARTSETARHWMTLRRWENGVITAPPPTLCSQLVFSTASLEEASGNASTWLDAELARLCPFRGAKELARWYRTKDTEERARLFEAVFRADQQRVTAVRIAESSLALGQIWETGSARKRDFDGLEVLLGQPEALKIRQQITRRSRSLPEI